MPSSISDASGVKVSYSYLSDGTKLSALKPNGEGLVYRGPFVYRRSSGGSLNFESVSADEGRLSSAGEMLYVEDYLGSVRAVVSGSGGTLLEASDYSAFGARVTAPSAPLGTTPAGITLRDHYTAQEDQAPDFAVPYTDFGARQYNTALRRWMTPDPLSEKYYGISPYAFCNNSPMVFVDPDGRDGRIYVNKKSRTITIYATYYTLENDASLIKSINEAIRYFNNESEYKYIFKGKEYKVVFYLKNEPTTKNVINGSINSSGNNLIMKTNQSVLKDGKIVLGYIHENDLKRKIILINSSSTREPKVIAHEIGHSLGAEHDTEGLMVESIQDDHKTYITENNINEIITFLLNTSK